MRIRSTSFRDERGVILPLTLIVLVVLATMVSALLALGLAEPQIAANLVRGAQALSLGEAGIDRAVAYYQVTANQAAVNNACDPTCAAGTTTLFNAQTDVTTGTYTVTTKEISYGTVLVESTGTVPVSFYRATVGDNDVKRTVRVIVTKAWASQFGVLGNTVEITGSSSVYGNQGAVQGNTSTKVDTNALVQKSATTSSLAVGDCNGCSSANLCTTANCSTAQPPPNGSKGVGIPAGDGTGAPTATLPSSTPGDFAPKATIILGGGGTADPSIPGAKCSTVQVYNASSNNFTGTYSGTTVPQHWVLDATSTACKLYPDNSNAAVTSLTGYTAGATSSGGNAFSNFNMHGAGEWEIAGNVTPPAGAYFATKEIKVTGTPGSAGTPWNATLIAGSASEEGRVEVTGNSVISAFSSPPTWPGPGGLLAIAGEIKAEGNTTLTGTLLASGSGGNASGAGSSISGVLPDEGKLELKGSVVLKGNAVTAGRAKVDGNATVIYNVASRMRILSPKLLIVNWTAATTLE